MNENIIGRRTTAWVDPLMPGSPSPSSSLPRLGFYICFCDLINQSTQGGKGASSERTRILAHLGLPCRGKPAASAPVVLCWWQGWHQLLLFWANVDFRYDPPTWRGGGEKVVLTEKVKSSLFLFTFSLKYLSLSWKLKSWRKAWNAKPKYNYCVFFKTKS